MAASRGEELNTRLTATDDASKVVDDVAEKVADLEDRDHDIDLSADTDDVDNELSALDKRLRGLTDDEKRIVLGVAAKDAQRDLDRINRDLARAEKYDDDEINIRIQAKGDAERKLDAIQSEIRDIDGASPNIRPEVDSSQLDSFVDKLEDLTGGRLGGLGALRGRAGVGFGAAVAAGFTLAADAAANAAIEVGNLSALTGDTVETASRLSGIWQTTGADAKDLQDVILQMGDVLADDAELARQIGVNLDDSRPLGERFIEVVDLLGDKFDNAGERSLVAARLFGEEGVRQVNAVTAAYGDLSAAVDEYNGKVFTEQDVENAREYKVGVEELKNEFKKLGADIGSDVVPVLGDVLTGLNDITSWVEENTGKGLFEGLSSVLFGDPEQVKENQRLLGVLTEDARDLLQSTVDAAAAAPALGEGFKSAGREAEDAIAGVGRSLGDVRDEADQEPGSGFFGGLKSQAEDAGEAIEEDVLGPLDLLRKRLDEEDTFARLAEQFNKVKANPEDREETRRLLRMVLDLGDAYEDLPPQVVTKLFTEIDQGSLDAAQATLLSLSSGRAVNFTVNPGVAFQVDPTGRNAPQQVDTTPQIGTTVINNYYPVAPTSSAVTRLSRDATFANGSRQQQV